MLVKDGDDSDRWWEDHLATSKAWKAMWEQVLAIHTDRHRQLVEWADDTKADHVIREHLLATFPWLVEPALLEEIATDDLARFSRNVLITRICRSLRDGAPKEKLLADHAADLAALQSDDLRHVEAFLDDAAGIQQFGCQATTSWIERAAEGSWRYVRVPEEAKDRIGRPDHWDASTELLRALGRRFAEAAVQALKLWEPQPRRRIRIRLTCGGSISCCSICRPSPMTSPSASELCSQPTVPPLEADGQSSAIPNWNGSDTRPSCARQSNESSVTPQL
ncbi:hypothetical protein [Micromonospora zhanjiangensis]